MRNIIPHWLKEWPLHSILLLFFFITNAYNQYAGMISGKEMLSVSFMLSAGLLAVFGSFYRWFKNVTKAGIAATITGFFYLFFGHFKEMLRKTDFLQFISHYKTLLPLLMILFIIFTYRLRKTNPPLRLNLFLNILFIFYSVLEVWNINKPTFSANDLIPAGKQLLSFKKPSENMPDIFYILLDAYPSSRYQQEVLDAGVNELDLYLEKKGFCILKNPKSNYNYTSFSIASTLNMDYLKWLHDPNEVKPYQYNRSMNLVKKSVIIQWLRQHQYNVVNLSIFDLPGSPATYREKFLSTTGKEIILYYTLYNCLRRDVIPELFPSLRTATINRMRAIRKARFKELKQHNQFVLDSLLKFQLNNEQPYPVLLYAHLVMPHFPYHYDSSGRSYPEELVYGKEMITSKERFKNYIGYTNRQAMAVIERLQTLTNGQAIIIIQSDHGLNDLAAKRKQDAFNNYSAFYFPDRQYKMLYDSMSNVNSFRIIFNKYFGQRLPLLKDTSIYIK